MARFGLVRPNTDAQAATLYNWGSAVRDQISKTPPHVIAFDLRPRLIWIPVTPVQVLASLGGADVIFYFGHGGPSDWLGRGSLLSPVSARATADKIVIAIACDSAMSLGPACVGAGARAYVGFRDRLTWSTAASAEFGAVIAGALSGFVRYGDPVGSGVTRMRDGFAAIVDKFKHGSGRHHVDAVAIWLAANQNLQAVTGLGDAAATPP